MYTFFNVDGLAGIHENEYAKLSVNQHETEWSLVTITHTPTHRNVQRIDDTGAWSNTYYNSLGHFTKETNNFNTNGLNTKYFLTSHHNYNLIVQLQPLRISDGYSVFNSIQQAKQHWQHEPHNHKFNEALRLFTLQNNPNQW